MALVANPNEPGRTMEDLSTKEEAMRDIESAPAEELLHTAAEVVAGKVAGSDIFDSTAEARIPKFDKHELTLGRVLGRGGFCVVREIEKIKTCESSSGGGSMPPKRSLFKILRRPLKAKKNPMTSPAAVPRSGGSDIESFVDMECVQDIVVDVKLSRDFVASRSKSKKTGGRYVIKRVAAELERDDAHTFLKGVVDLAMEKKFLAALDHPNIIKLCGEYTRGPCTEGYFVVLEKLTETLAKRIKKWTDIKRNCQGFPGVFMGSKRTMEDLMTKRLLAANDIARGGAYMHSRKVMFRDLKPDNIGYDSNGVLKLFDFGLARELKESERSADGLYNLTGFTGAVRYMAPEVGLGKPYNEKADVYSWSMLMWYMLALEPPFGLYTEKMLAERVMKRGTRPQVFKRWSAALSDLIKQAWHEDSAERPSFHEISRVLKQEVFASNSKLSPTA